MNHLATICQILAALGILNVWLLRPRKTTAYRGGGAKDMKEEFAVYGLPGWFMYLIGVVKVTLAFLLLAGLWIPEISKPAAMGLGVLMVGALAMHFKAKDLLKKYIPATAILALCIAVIVI